MPIDIKQFSQGFTTKLKVEVGFKTKEHVKDHSKQITKSPVQTVS